MSISDRYEGMELLQSTPTGEIYRARHRTLGRPVLIRTLDTTLLEPAELEQIREAGCVFGAVYVRRVGGDGERDS